MTLEDQLLNEFAKTMNTKEEDVETTAVGTIISVTRASETQLYDICTVRLDGANVDTPARMGVDGKVNDRVTVRIRKHKATVTGNLTSPGYTNTDKIDGISNYVTNGYLELHYLDSDFITTHYLTADQIQTDYITANTIAATYATIENLRSTNAEITNIKAQYVKTTELDAAVINSSVINANFAKIDLTNIAAGTIKQAMIDTGAIGTAQIADGSITDAKIVGLTASKITSGTIDAGVINVVNLDAANITVGTINGVQISDNAININKLTTELADYVTDASETAHRKNRVYHQDSAPQDTDLIPGDTWFDTSNGFKMYRCVESGSLTDENGNVLTDENGNPLTAVRWEEERYSTSAIAAKAITTEHLTAGCITSEQIVARAISADKIASKSITANEIMAETITANEIKAGTITAAQIAVGTITADKIAAGTITADKINVSDLFAQDITATGTIRGVELIAASGTFTGRIEFNWNSNPAYRTTLKIGSPLSAESPIFLSQADSAGTVTSKTFIYGSLIKLKNASGDRYTELYNSRLDVLHEINSNDAEFVSIFPNEVYVANNISGVSHIAELTVNGVQLGSDVRLKENIVSFDPALSLYIRPVSFNYKGDSLQHYGFIAQEVQKIIPDAVSEGRSGYLSLNYQELIAPTLALAQDNARRLDALERRYS